MPDYTHISHIIIVVFSSHHIKSLREQHHVLPPRYDEIIFCYEVDDTMMMDDECVVGGHMEIFGTQKILTAFSNE